MHGLGGDSETTWGKFPEFLRKDASIARRYAVASFSFPTAIWRLPFMRKAPKIQVLASALKTQINGRFRAYSDITLVCHSLGGVIAREYVLEEIKDNIPLKVSGLVLFAVPNNGSELANAGKFVSWTNRQLRQLSKESDFLDGLNKDWLRQKVSDKIRLRFIDGMQDSVVKRESALYVSNKDTDTINRGHRDIVKPTYADDDAVIIVRDFLLANTEGRGKPTGGTADAARHGDHERKRGNRDFDNERIDRFISYFLRNRKTPRSP
jgi:pimeloyl-ACP methyl ester carboxylesterase